MKTLGKQGDFKSNVLKINIPRNDLKVTIDGIATPTPFGFGGWLAMTKGNGGTDVMMGDLVLTDDEVKPVMSALLENGLEVTALHGKAADLARMAKPAVDLIGHGSRQHQSSVAGGQASVSAGQMDTAKIAVLKALRSNGLNVVAIHNHMTSGAPAIYFLHYWGTGPAAKLATGSKAALDQLGHAGPS